MFTDIDHDIDKQVEWFRKISSDETAKYWIVNCKEKPIGLVLVSDLDFPSKRCEVGFYLGDHSYSMIAGRINPFLYNYLFNVLFLNKVWCYVMEGNHNIMQINELHGFRKVGVFEQHVYKYGKFHDVFIYELLAKQWKSLEGKYAHLVADL